MSYYPMLAFSIAVTFGAYVLFRWLYAKVMHPLFNVVLLAAATVVAVLLGCGMTYEDYVPGKDVMTFLLGPATVGLAVPLYRNRYLLRRYGKAILGSVLAGAAVSMLTSGLFARLGGLPESVVISMIPKGVTIPFAVDISRIYGGEPPLSTAFVVANGTLGAMLGAWLSNRSRIYDPVARGLSMGTVAHGQGTAMAFLEGERQGAMAGLAMTLAGVFTALLAPFIVPFFQ